MARNKWLRLAIAILAYVATCPVAGAIDTLTSSKTPMVLTSRDFPDIPADPRVCQDVGLKCLEPVSGENRVALPRPVRFIDFKTVSDLGIEVPSSKGIIPIIAFVEVPDAPVDKAVTISASDARKLRSKFHPISEFEWNAAREDVAMPFFSSTDPEMAADGLCLTAAGHPSVGPYLNCFIYRFRKSGHVYDASIVGVILVPRHAIFDGGEGFNYPTDFLRRVGPSLTAILASSKFLTLDTRGKELTVTNLGARVVVERPAVNDPDELLAMVEIIVRTDFSPKPDRTFEIAAETTVNLANTRFARGDIFWSLERPQKATQDEWENETKRVVAKLGKALCQIYGNRHVVSDEEPSDGSVHLEERSIGYRITCSAKDPRRKS